MISPLQSTFEALCPRLGLGAAELFDLHRVLAAGFAGSRAELVALCQTLWAKTPDDLDLVARALLAVLPPPFSPDDLRELERNPTKVPTDLDSTREGSNQLDEPRTTAAPNFTAVGPGESSSGGDGGLPLRPHLRLDHVADPWRFNLTGDGPALFRALLREWRAYRRMAPGGREFAIDVPATIRRRLADGVLLSPVWAGERRNRVSMTLLIDVSRSMMPFRWQVSTLMAAAERAGFGRFSVAYFDNVPGDTLAADPTLARPIALDAFLRESAAEVVVVVSDAGAARGTLNSNRSNQTVAFVRAARACVPRVGWINPMRVRRWLGTTAESIRTVAQITMVELSSRGLSRLVATLRGREQT